MSGIANIRLSDNVSARSGAIKLGIAHGDSTMEDENDAMVMTSSIARAYVIRS